MSYQGGGRNGNGYWPAQGPPNTFEHDRAHLPPSSVPVQYQQYAQDNRQVWAQNGQVNYGGSSNYPNNGYQQAPASQLQVQQPQYISPAQIFQQPPPQHQYQRSSSHLSNGQSNMSSLSRYSTTPSTLSSDSSADTALLLISLAEEYFDAAHELAPTAVRSMTTVNVGVYEKLIATGLGCLDTALKRVRLGPRMEANIRLRYAAVLLEETENFMEGEMALSKGIALCERNHYHDLKYAMQFLLAQFMAKKNPKASAKALEGYISDAQLYQHPSWVYAFRFLRASHCLASGNPTDSHAALQNLRAITELAVKHDDKAIFTTASLMAALAYLRLPGADAVEQVQRQIAASRAHQHDPSCRILQLMGLAHILDVASSLRQGNPAIIKAKNKEMLDMMDDALKDPNWSTASDTITIPIKRTVKASAVVGQDTRMVLGIRDGGGDNLFMAFLNKKDAYAVTCLLCGMVLLQGSSSDHRGIKYLTVGLDTLDDAKMAKPSPGLLPDLVARRAWRGLIRCYCQGYMAFCSAALADWAKVKESIDAIRKTAREYDIALQGPLESLTVYLLGCYHQGIGDFDAALKIFDTEIFQITNIKPSASSNEQVERDIALLAALNTLCILQDKPRQDPSYNVTLMERLEKLCAQHPNKDIETAFYLIAATVNTNPPTELYKIKQYLRAALTGAKETGNTQFLCITLNVMCSRFFSGVVGDQAEKSAKAASIQAQKSGNALWMSVGEGMLAQCYDTQGKKVEAQKALEQAHEWADKALPGH